MLRTTIVTNGFSIGCLVTDTKTLKPKAASPTQLSLIDQAKAFTRRKRPQSDILPQDWKLKVKKIIGVDFGETFSGGFSMKNVADYSVDSKGELSYDSKAFIHNLAIKSTALNEPTRSFQNWLEHGKKLENSGVFETETIFEKELQLEKKSEESYLDYVKRWKVLYSELSQFYNSKKASPIVKRLYSY